jgi:hypothetical protein
MTPPFKPTHIAVIGPNDHPKDTPVVWRYKAAIPSFHAVETADGKLLLVHCMKLRPVEEGKA